MTMPPISLPGNDLSKSSALDQAMAATLAAINVAPGEKEKIEVPKPVEVPKKAQVKVAFKDKKEAIEAFKELLRDRVC